MDDPLLLAKKYARLLRYSEDKLTHRSQFAEIDDKVFRGYAYSDGLLITDHSAPTLFFHLKNVYKILGIPDNSVEAFVYASPDLNAGCFSGNGGTCIIRFSSALINLLELDEFAFVAGHELGHFLLDHWHQSKREEDHNIEYYITKRAAEISVDRVGLVSSGSLQASIRAMIKSISGLDSEHLRFDVNQFISQADKTTGIGSSGFGNSHPSMVSRCRAVLWFSMDTDLGNYPEGINRDHINKLDQRIKRDMDKYVDGTAREMISEAKQELNMWITIQKIVETGSFKKDHQDSFKDSFGEELLAKTKQFLSSLNKETAPNLVIQKVNEAKAVLARLAPDLVENEFVE